ncbi:hypothetical protein ACFWXK_38675 [Streptomyces sp. NPDC059070]|uniref:hypothetical protein n=1 Tax=Streptomyces sp. NPDC059070 TaxID=3346713 RepID=UPI003686759E
MTRRITTHAGHFLAALTLATVSLTAGSTTAHADASKAYKCSEVQDDASQPGGLRGSKCDERTDSTRSRPSIELVDPFDRVFETWECTSVEATKESGDRLAVTGKGCART